MRTLLPDLMKKQPGDTIIMGKHPALGELEWTVLDLKDDRMLLLSRFVLEADRFSLNSNHWESSQLYKKLNREWLTEWFDWIEVGLIFDDSDPLTLLSTEEVRRYFPEPGSAAAPLLEVEGGQREYTDWSWWLRSPGFDEEFTAYVTASGHVNEFGVDCTCDEIGVRPAFWLDLSRLPYCHREV